ncbi:hypothetical protein RJ639_021191 [Escallonia herrerae]|uniref:Protein kinase domain-containing protein n=1 Tax=Escallonia herrerae TaxID=1293975 RepID=A0AA88V5I7_9ASTE|nr:hypothetical protein RJ639_021191 [Escallonia herrerae]
MLRARLVVVVGLVALVCALLQGTPSAKRTGNLQQEYCSPSSCGDIGNITSPFRLRGDQRRCNERYFELICENNRTVLYWSAAGKYYVKSISYINRTIRLVDVGLDKDFCSILRASSPNPYPDVVGAGYYAYLSVVWPATLYFVACASPVDSPKYVNFSSCTSHGYFYAVVTTWSDDPSIIHDTCNISVAYPCPRPGDVDSSNLSISSVHQQLIRGFEMSWYMGNLPFIWRVLRWVLYPVIFFLNLWTYHRDSAIAFSTILGGYLVGRTSIGIVCLILVLVYRYRRRHLSMDDSIESFLQGHNNFMPIRYSYSEIKQMTKCFNDKLGEGGYGSVFKAKLRSGRFVAVKLLGKSKASGQDFISEVGTIGRIHHVNVVQLIGFCAEGSKRALVYEFMPNASLDKFIFSGAEKKTTLSWDTIYEIALGVARGIEYLHRGCDIQILHFDIKPHNILLDENFVPKVSDFGLAKLYSTDDSIVSLTAARGTLGYIAPELFYKSIGGVSFKADVYSFGMLLMEMVGRRKNVNARADHSSKIYFPSWIYDRIEQGGDMELGNVSEYVGKLARKMTLVALWCIQMKPVDRPSMSKVIDMLEGEVELLQIPHKPTFYPQEVSVAEDLGISSSSSDIDISITN